MRSVDMYQAPESGQALTIEKVDRWLVRAIESLLSSWDDTSGMFWRDSYEVRSATDEDHKSTLESLGKGTTSNNRSFQALVAAASFLHDNLEEIPNAKEIKTRVDAAVVRMGSTYFTQELDQIRTHSENGENPFTDAQHLLSLSLCLSPVTKHVCGLEVGAEETKTLLRYLRFLAKHIATKDLKSEGVRVHDLVQPHHFLTLHSVRALDAARRTLEGQSNRGAYVRFVDVERNNDLPALVGQVRTEIVKQLGLHLLPAPGFDGSALVSSCALLSRFSGDADSPLLRQAVTALVEDQSERGTWTSPGVLSFSRRRMVFIPSFELSVVLTNLTLRDLQEGDTELFDLALPALESSFRLVQSSFRRDGLKQGWGNDRTQSGYEIESWTTAVVLQFLVALRAALSLAQQEQILKKYRADRSPASFPEFWSDLDSLVPDRPQYRILRTGKLPLDRLENFTALVDPTADNSIVTRIQEEILEPTLRSENQRPHRTASFLLYGPPGTRKTTLVERMAEELGWPLITLSPPAFLRNGIEGFEASADEIFEDLAHIKRVVVLFDECEEFFKWRPPDMKMESRTIGAFITSGMLPRLQRLRKRRWIVFVINTNVEAFELDDAVTRRGRLDKIARMGHPELSAQLRYLKSWEMDGVELSSNQLKWFERHLARVEAEMAPHRADLASLREDAQKKNPDRGQKYRDTMADLASFEATLLTRVVTLSSLDTLAERCLSEDVSERIDSAESLWKNLLEEFDRFGPDSFTPKPPSD